MISILKLTAASLTLFLLTSISATMVFAQDPDAGKVAWEEQVWQCQACHGPAGEGGWGSPLAGNTNPIQDWIDQVRTPRRSMPSFSAEQVSDETITDIHAYLTSLAEPADFTRPDAGLPADAPAGQTLIVEKRCVACHKTTGPIGGYIERGEVPTADMVIAQLRNPRKNMPAYSEGQVSNDEAALMADFMAAQVSEQLAPATLPSSGGERPGNPAVWLVLLGVGLLLGGLTLRQFTGRQA